jgi:hypothetical protein
LIAELADGLRESRRHDHAALRAIVQKTHHERAETRHQGGDDRGARPRAGGS